MENKNKFEIVSRAYGNNFKTVTFIVFNSETGELKKEVFDNTRDETVEEEQSEYETCKHDGEIRADTAKNIQHEIKELSHAYPNGEAQRVWNHAIAEAANCCNGYEQEVE